MRDGIMDTEYRTNLRSCLTLEIVREHHGMLYLRNYDKIVIPEFSGHMHKNCLHIWTRTTQQTFQTSSSLHLRCQRPFFSWII